MLNKSGNLVVYHPLKQAHFILYIIEIPFLVYVSNEAYDIQIKPSEFSGGQQVSIFCKVQNSHFLNESMKWCFWLWIFRFWWVRFHFLEKLDYDNLGNEPFISKCHSVPYLLLPQYEIPFKKIHQIERSKFSMLTAINQIFPIKTELDWFITQFNLWTFSI
jgi:hypothetical protein